MTVTLVLLAATALLVGICALFSAAEAAFQRMTPAHAARLAAEERPGSQRLRGLLAEAPRTLSTIALVVLISQIGAAVLLALMLAQWLLLPAAAAAAAVIALVVLFVGGEVAPKTMAVERTDRVALRTSGPVLLASRLLRPIVSLLLWAGRVVAPGRGLAEGPFVTEDHIRDLVDTAEEGSVIEERERAMIHSIFELGDTLVREIMVPRPDVLMLSASDAWSTVVAVVVERGLSRIPVHAEHDRDEIIGLLYAKDVLRELSSGEGDPSGDRSWLGLLREPFVVPELKSVDSLLREMQAQQVHLAVVVDEYGAVAGIATIEDILEEIVGEIVDEFDAEDVLVETLEADRWRVDARLPVDELEALVGGAHLPDDEWDTVGGLFFGTLGHIPRTGEAVRVDGLVLKAEKVTGRRIQKVLVERVSADDQPDPERSEAAR